MKKYILISILLMLFSCGSRNSTKEKSVEKISERLKQITLLASK